MANDMSRHEKGVQALVDEGCERYWFAKNLAKAVAERCNCDEVREEYGDATDIDDDPIQCEYCQIRTFYGGNRFIPDAHRIDAAEQIVTCYEVHIWNHVVDEKIEDYINMFWLLDEYYWQLRLITVDRYGNRGEVDLLRWHVEQSNPGYSRQDIDEHVSRVRERSAIRAPGESRFEISP